jgi:uncharacterized lipoprotein YbaY
MNTPIRHAAPLVVVLLAALAIAGCGQKGAGQTGKQPTSRISGVLVLAPGQSMPAGMPLELELAELTSAKQASAPIAAGKLESAAGAETPFSLEYDAAKVQSDRQYVVRARAAIQGTTYLAGNALAPVAAQAAAFPVDVVLRRPPNASPLYLDVSVLRLDYKGESDWSGKLRDVMPGMLACLRSVSGKGLGGLEHQRRQGRCAHPRRGRQRLRVRSARRRLEVRNALRPAIVRGGGARRRQSRIRTRAGLAEDGRLPPL